MLIDAPIRGQDPHGNGAYLAPRVNHKHRYKHEGIDIACYAGSGVLAASAGTVTKIGYPYPPSDPRKGHLRYVQVTDAQGRDCRYFYVSASVAVGDTVQAGDRIGTTQGLRKIFPGITDHFHFEVLADGQPIDPEQYIKEAAGND